MARGRMLNRRISKDKRVADLIQREGPYAGLLFTWLIAHLDRDGRFEGDPGVVCGAVFPRLPEVNIPEVAKMLRAMADLGLIYWYETNGDKYIAYPGFEANQLGLRKNREPESEVPPPPETVGGKVPEDCRQSAGKVPEDCRKIADILPAEGKGREGKGIEGNMSISKVAAQHCGGGNVAAEVQVVWDAYRGHHPSCAGNLSSKRKEYTLIKARLGEKFPVSDLVSSIHGYHRSPHHLGLNDTGTIYLGLELMMRDAPHVERGLGFFRDEGLTKRAMLGEKGRKNQYVMEQLIHGGDKKPNDNKELDDGE